ncbi:MAG: cupredoxin domain-containing protein, partial [Chloroflexota bacterium]|nr:cupredoxin domain-containing protein [Chloroflexota bacterium]
PPTLAPQATPGGGATAPEDEPAAEGGGDVVTLEAQDPYAWSVYELEASPGQVIQVTNVGFLEHNFTVDELGIAEDLPPGEPVDVTVPEDVAVGDTYVYYCSVPGHREGGMEGTLTIVEAGAAAPAGESTEASPEASQGATPEEAAAEAVPAEGGGDPITLEAQDPFAWSVNEIEASPGQVIQATNVGFLEHNFTVDELGIAEDLPPGEPVDITVPDDAAAGDTFEYYCSVPGHREGGMVGTLTIV